MKRLVLAVAVALATSLFAPPSGQARGQAAFPDKTRAWIVVSQDDQQMLIYEGNRLVRTLPVSTGWPGLRKSITPVFRGRIGEYWGSFYSFSTWQDHGYFLFTDYLAEEGDEWSQPGNGPWNGDVLFHGAPYRFGPNGEKDYIRDGIGTTPTSNGCIRLLPEDAEWMAEWDPVGVAIEIRWFTHGLEDYPKLGFGAQVVGATQNAAVPAPAENAARP